MGQMVGEKGRQQASLGQVCLPLKYVFFTFFKKF